MNQEEKNRIYYEQNHKEIDGVIYKYCSKHNEYFPDEDEWILYDTEHFYKNKGSSDGLFPYCKKCNVRNSSKYQQIDNREHYLEYKRNEHKRKYTPDKREYFREVSRRSRAKGNLKNWQRNNPDKLKEYREYREMNKQHTITKEEWLSCKEYFNNCCAYCGLPIEEHFNTFAGKLKHTDFHREHVDHNGANNLSNCVPSCKTCNSSKCTDKLEDWYIRQDFYNEVRLNKIHKWLNEDYKLYMNNDNLCNLIKGSDDKYTNV